MVDLLHHGDAEAGRGLLDFAVNVYAGPAAAVARRRPARRPRRGRRLPRRRPRPRRPRAARHGRDPGEVLATAGAAEAFNLSPGCALAAPGRGAPAVHRAPRRARAGRPPRHRWLPTDPSRFALDPRRSPTTPTSSCSATRPTRPVCSTPRPPSAACCGRVGWSWSTRRSWTPCPASPSRWPTGRCPACSWSAASPSTGASPASGPATSSPRPRWSPTSGARRCRGRSPSRPPRRWSACSSPAAVAEAERRAATLVAWRSHLEKPASTTSAYGTCRRTAPFVLAQVGTGVHAALRERAIAVRRADTFPGLGPAWVRIAVRPTGHDRPTSRRAGHPVRHPSVP